MIGYGMNPVNLYLGVFVFNMLADRIAYRGTAEAGEKSHEWTRRVLFVSWYALMAAPIYELLNYPRDSAAVSAAGVLITLAGTFIRASGIYTLGQFFSPHVENWSHQRVVEKGLYRYIRHPAYAGNIFQAAGMPLILNAYFSLTLSAVTITLFLVRLLLEEEMLAEKLPGYREYMKKTKRIIPGLW